jgi:hypothetical protein
MAGHDKARLGISEAPKSYNVISLFDLFNEKSSQFLFLANFLQIIGIL